MTRRFQRLEAYFHELSALPTPERERALERIAKEDSELHEELTALLHQHAAPASAADDAGSGHRQGSAIDDLVDDARAARAEGLQDPQQLGRYRLLRLLGEGGMGRVYEAEQTEPVTRRVAIKLIRPGMNSESVLERFRLEQQALAMMDHPQIARVFDVSTTDDGRPYFVMELVEGLPITRFCDQHQMELPERLALFEQVCRAVHHAHQKGIIHRDLKASNVLVADTERGPAAKVIDFGIARATDRDLVRGATLTALGELIGTPETMSPEQASLGKIDVDTRSDVYSLGLMLYELLVGALPVGRAQLHAAGFEEMLRSIREDATPRPSERASTLASSRLAELRAMTPDSLPRALKGDLDWIALKALAKDRNRRYDSAAALADDVRRFLDQDPVLAGPPTWRYRSSKFLRRHRVAVGALSAIGLALVLGATLALVGLQRARAAEREAATGRQVAEETTDFLVSLFRGSDPRSNVTGASTLEELLQTGVERIDQLNEQPRVQSQLLYTLGDVYWAMGRPHDAKPLLERSAALQQDAPDAEPWFDAGIYFEAQHRLASVDLDEEHYDEAVVRLERLLTEASSRTSPDASEVGATHNMIGLALTRLRRTDDALGHYQEALRIARLHEDPAGESVAAALNNLASLFTYRREHAASREHAEQALAILEDVLPAGHPSLAILHNNLSVTCKRLGELRAAQEHSEKAVQLGRAAWGDDHPNQVDLLFGLSQVQTLRGDDEAVLRSLDEAESVLGRAQEPGVWRRQMLWSQRGLALLKLGRSAEGISALRQAVEIDADASVVRTTSVLLAMRNLATALRWTGQPNDAAPLLDEAVRLADSASNPADQSRLRLQLAMLEHVRSRPGVAHEHYEEANRLAGCTSAGPCPSIDDPLILVPRAAYLSTIGELDRAFELLTEAADRPARDPFLMQSPDLAALRGHTERWGTLSARWLANSP